jgi:hypothetical protein
MTDTKEASAKLVRDFLGSRQARSLETICSGFADDSVYHNVPVEPIEGIAAIRAIRCQARYRHTGRRARPGAPRARRPLHHERRPQSCAAGDRCV